VVTDYVPVFTAIVGNVNVAPSVWVIVIVSSHAAVIVKVTKLVAPPLFVASTFTTSVNSASGFTEIVGYLRPSTSTTEMLTRSVFVQEFPSFV